MAVIAADDIENLRERVDLVEIISGHTQLRKAGRIFKGLCPFHQEKTPSFTVDPDKRLYHCFGCGAGGDAFTFVRQVEGLSFSEAAERLANRYGVSLKFEGAEKAGGHRKSLLDAVQIAAGFFADTLNRLPEATGARKYLEARGFSSDDARAWGIGYSPGAPDTLYRHLLTKKFNSKQIVDAGLALVNESGEHRDRFRSRLMFPIADVTGQIVGFGARSLGDQQPKYLNSPETTIYHKAKILFGLDRARQQVSNQGLAVVTEGYTDVIALHKVGIATAVATCGTALGEDHLQTLKRFCDRVILAFDADAAGAVASERAFGIHASVGLEVLVAPIPAGKDPADVALGGSGGVAAPPAELPDSLEAAIPPRSNEGADAVGLMLEQAIPLMRFVVEAEISRHRLDTPEGKAKAVRAAAALLSWEPNRVARGEHAFWVARRIGIDAEEVQREIAEVAERKQRGTTTLAPVRRPGHVKLEREALALLMESSSRLTEAAQWINSDHFTIAEHRVLLHALMESAKTETPGNLMDRLPDDGSRRLAAELALAPITSDDREQIFDRLEEFRLRRQIDSLRATLDRLDAGADLEKYDALFKELMRLEEERRKFDET